MAKKFPSATIAARIGPLRFVNFFSDSASTCFDLKPENESQVFQRKDLPGVFLTQCLDHLLMEQTFMFKDLQNPLLHRVFHPQIVHGHRLGLPEAVNPVLGLPDDCRVPPVVKVHDVVGGRQRQAMATCDDGAQKHPALRIALETSDGLDTFMDVHIPVNERHAIRPKMRKEIIHARFAES